MKVAKLKNNKPEIYLAVQGEGKTAGTPIVFTRLSNCNLGCQFCDSAYTWFFKGTKYPDNWNKCFKKAIRENIQMEMTPREVADKIKKVAGVNKSVVFTGGEPTIQQKEIVEVINILGKDWYVEIETNGTILPSKELDERVSQYNCSPKLESSVNPKYLRDQEKVMNFLSAAAWKDRACFKFVIGKKTRRNDLREVKMLEKKYNLPKKQIYLMPEGIETKEMIQNTKEMVEVCKELGYKLSTRIQIILYGPKRAV